MHLAMAALVGASFVAVSAYYMHRKTLNQLLEFAKTLEKDRDDDGVIEEGDELLGQHYRKRRNNNSNSTRRNVGVYRRASASMPDVSAVSGAISGVEEDGFPVGLPKLHTLPEGW